MSSIMTRGFSKIVNCQQKQIDSLPSLNILNTSFLEHFANVKGPRIERSKEHLLIDTALCLTIRYNNRGDKQEKK